MADSNTQNQTKYLDLNGLKHLLDQLSDSQRIPAHPTGREKAEGAYKISVDTNGHVQAGDTIKPSDIGAAASSDVKNATIKIRINGVEKDFTLNQATNETLEWTISAGDLGVDTALHFRGVVSNTAAITDPVNGDVCLIGSKEHIYANGTWYELGDEASHALKTIKVSGDNNYITGGGTLASDITLKHKDYGASHSKALGAYNVAIDSAGHISNATVMEFNEIPAHNHTITTEIPANTYGESISNTSANLTVNASGGQTADVVSSYNGAFSKLGVTEICGVGTNTTKASYVSTSEEINYGTADVGDTVTGLAVRGSEINYGTADVADSATTVMSGVTASDTIYTAKVENECLNLTAITLTPQTIDIHEAVACDSTRKTYGCTSATKSVTSAKKADSTHIINNYTFNDVVVPIKASTPTTVATGSLVDASTTGATAGAQIMTGLGTKNTTAVVQTEKSYTLATTTTGGVSVLTSSTLNKNSAKKAITSTATEAGKHTPTVKASN